MKKSKKSRCDRSHPTLKGALVLLASGLVLASTYAMAECSQYGCVDVYVDKLELTASGGLWVQTTGNETLANCTPNSGVYLYVPPGGNFNAVYATLLAAQLSEKKVYFRINEGSNPCSVAYVTLARQ